MPPTTSRDFQKVAGQRLATAETLLRNTLTLDAQYVGGYTVECSLKALILQHTPVPEQSEMLRKISSAQRCTGRTCCSANYGKNFGVRLPVEIAKRMRRFDWTTALRYETGRRDRGETIGFLKTAIAIYNWVEGQLP